VPGHSLLITRNHFCSFAQLPSGMLGEFRDVRDQAISQLVRTYADPLLFEHGSSAELPSSGVCIQHAHIHLVPVQAPVEEWLGDFGNVTAYDMFAAASRRDDPPENYLWYRSQLGQEYLVRDFFQPVPSQFVRRALADHLEIRTWNWKSVLARFTDGSQCSATSTDLTRG